MFAFVRMSFALIFMVCESLYCMNRGKKRMVNSISSKRSLAPQRSLEKKEVSSADGFGEATLFDMFIQNRVEFRNAMYALHPTIAASTAEKMVDRTFASKEDSMRDLVNLLKNAEAVEDQLSSPLTLSETKQHDLSVDAKQVQKASTCLQTLDTVGVCPEITPEQELEAKIENISCYWEKYGIKSADKYYENLESGLVTKFFLGLLKSSLPVEQIILSTKNFLEQEICLPSLKFKNIAQELALKKDCKSQAPVSRANKKAMLIDTKKRLEIFQKYSDQGIFFKKLILDSLENDPNCLHPDTDASNILYSRLLSYSHIYKIISSYFIDPNYESVHPQKSIFDSLEDDSNVVI